VGDSKMGESKKGRFGRTKVALIVCAVLVVVLAFSNVWFFLENKSLQNQVNTLETDKSTLNSQIAALQNETKWLEYEIDVLRGPRQVVVNYLEGNFGFDVTFVYFGSNRTLTYDTEDCALVVMLTGEHVKNFGFTETHEWQFYEGKNALQTAFHNAEVFIVLILEDLNGDGVPDPSVNGYSEISGGVYGGRAATAFVDDYWKYAEYYVAQ
jgi:outer membrane murein-binding lipoprotein Lpp